jgi:hypothetical protein
VVLAAESEAPPKVLRVSGLKTVDRQTLPTSPVINAQKKHSPAPKMLQLV